MLMNFVLLVLLSGSINGEERQLNCSKSMRKLPTSHRSVRWWFVFFFCSSLADFNMESADGPCHTMTTFYSAYAMKSTWSKTWSCSGLCGVQHVYTREQCAVDTRPGTEEITSGVQRFEISALWFHADIIQVVRVLPGWCVSRGGSQKTKNSGSQVRNSLNVHVARENISFKKNQVVCAQFRSKTCGQTWTALSSAEPKRSATWVTSLKQHLADCAFLRISDGCWEVLVRMEKWQNFDVTNNLNSEEEKRKEKKKKRRKTTTTTTTNP